MSDEILSQDEVDALLRGVTGEAEEVEEAESDQAGIRSYNLASQDRIVRGRMPTLEIINERFARLFRIGLFNFMRRTAEISVGQVKVMKYSEFIRNLVVPTNLNLVHVHPLKGTALFIFDPNLVFLVVDSMFGGDGKVHMRVEGRDFTPTEQRLIGRMLDVAFIELTKAWEPVFEVQFQYVRSEMNTQFANIATPSEVVVVTTFNIELGESGGDFHICLPYAMIEPIRDILYGSLQGERMEQDERWTRVLSRQLQNAEVELAATLASTEVTLGQILDLKVGDVISVDIADTVVGEVDMIPVVECGYGVANGRYALKVRRFIAPEEADDLMFEDEED